MYDSIHKRVVVLEITRVSSFLQNILGWGLYRLAVEMFDTWVVDKVIDEVGRLHSSVFKRVLITK